MSINVGQNKVRVKVDFCTYTVRHFIFKLVPQARITILEKQL